MHIDYDYECINCGEVESSPREIKTCSKCGSTVVSIKPTEK